MVSFKVLDRDQDPCIIYGSGSRRANNISDPTGSGSATLLVLPNSTVFLLEVWINIQIQEFFTIWIQKLIKKFAPNQEFAKLLLCTGTLDPSSNNSTYGTVPLFAENHEGRYLKVLGSLSRLTTERSTVRTFWVGFHRSQGSSPDWGSSTGGCRMEIHRSPFWKVKNSWTTQQ